MNIFDNKCEQNSDCPFYLGNLNYENTKFLDNIGIQGKIAINGVILKD